MQGPSALCRGCSPAWPLALALVQSARYIPAPARSVRGLAFALVVRLCRVWTRRSEVNPLTAVADAGYCCSRLRRQATGVNREGVSIDELCWPPRHPISTMCRACAGGLQLDFLLCKWDRHWTSVGVRLLAGIAATPAGATGAVPAPLVQRSAPLFALTPALAYNFAAGPNLRSRRPGQSSLAVTAPVLWLLLSRSVAALPKRRTRLLLVQPELCSLLKDAITRRRPRWKSQCFEGLPAVGRSR